LEKIFIALSVNQIEFMLQREDTGIENVEEDSLFFPKLGYPTLSYHYKSFG